MSTTFEIKINAIRTNDIGELKNVIKRVEFTIKGTNAGQSFELPQSVDLSDPQTESFVPLSELVQSDVIEWVNQNFSHMDAVKAHIQLVLDKEISKINLVETSLPWVTEEEEVIRQN